MQPVPASTVASVLEPAAARVLLEQLALAIEQLGNKAKARDDHNRVILVSEFAPERLSARTEADSARLQGDRRPPLRNHPLR